MAQTTEPYDGNGTRGSAGNALSFTFPYLKLTDVKVSLNGTTLATTEYTFPTATTLQFNTGSETTLQETSGAPKTGVSILIYRDTNVDSARHVFGQGSAFKSKDLNENNEQSLYFDQEVGDTANPKNFVTSAQISDGTSLSAADKTKLDGIEANSKDDQTGSEIASLLSDQNITTSGTIKTTSNVLTIEGTHPDLVFTDTNNNDDFKIHLENGILRFKDDQADRLKINSDGHIDITGDLDVNGLVDGRDIATDGTKLDGIEANAINASNAAITNKLPLAGGTMTGNLTVQNDAPKVILIDTDHSKHYRLMTNAGGFKIQDGNNSNADLFTIQDSGKCLFHNDAQVNNNLTVEGNLIVNGTSTTLNTATVNVDDKNIILMSIDSPTDSLANNGGFTLKGDTDKTFQWKNTTDSWTSSEHIALPDTKRVQFGDSRDFQIYFDGSVVRLVSDTTGTTSFQSQGDYLFRKGTSESLLKLIPDGAVEAYYDSIKRLETTANGIKVTGRIEATDDLYIENNAPTIYLTDNTNTHDYRIAVNSNRFKIEDTSENNITRFTVEDGGNVRIPQDNAKLQIGNDQDLDIWHSGSHSYIQNTTGNLFIHSNELVLRSTSQEMFIDCSLNGSVDLYYDNSKKLETTSTGAALSGNLELSGPGGNRSEGWTDSGWEKIDFDNSYSATPNGPNRIVLHDNTGWKAGFGVSNDEIGMYTGGHIALYTNTTDSTASAKETLARFNDNGSNELYYDNSKKFETTSSGATVVGQLTAGTSGGQNPSQTNWATNSAINLYGSYGGGIAFNDNGNNGFVQYVESQGNIYNLKCGAVGGSLEQAIKAHRNGQVELYHDNSKKFETTQTGTQISCSSDGDGLKLQGTTGRIEIAANTNRPGASNHILELDAHWNNTPVAFISLSTGDDTTNKDDGRLRFFTKPSGGTITERLKIEPDGNVLISGDNKRLKFGNSQDLEIYHGGTNSIISNTTGILLIRSDNLDLRPESNFGDVYLRCTLNAAVELRYDSVKKLETTSTGATVTTTSAANGIKNITTSTSGPSGGSDGDLWFTYVA